MRLYGECEQVRIAEALADLGRLGRGGGRSLVVTGCLMPEHEREQQIASLDAVTPLAFDEPLRASQPSGSAAHLSPE